MSTDDADILPLTAESEASTLNFSKSNLSTIPSFVFERQVTKIKVSMSQFYWSNIVCFCGVVNPRQ